MDRVTSTAGIHNHKQAVSGTSIVANWKRAVWHMDQPTLGGHAAVLMQLAKAAKPLVTVLLSGEGADELLGGYTRFANTAFRERVGPLVPLLTRIPGRGARGGTVLGDRWGQTDRVGAFLSDHGLDADVFTALRPRGDIEALLARRRAIFGEPSGDFLADCLKYDLRTYCVGLLVEQDKMTMASGVENRLPFLDHELVEWVRQLPTDYLVRGSLLPRHNVPRNTKRLLKSLAARRFGDDFAYRPKIGSTCRRTSTRGTPRSSRRWSASCSPAWRTGALSMPRWSGGGGRTSSVATTHRRCPCSPSRPSRCGRATSSIASPRPSRRPNSTSPDCDRPRAPPTLARSVRVWSEVRDGVRGHCRDRCAA